MTELEKLLNSVGSIAKNLAETKLQLHANKWDNMEVVEKNVIKELELLAERKVNAPTSSTVTWAAEEVYPGEFTLENVFDDSDISSEYAWINALSPARNDLEKGQNNRLPILTEPGLARWIGEWSTWAANNSWVWFNNVNTTSIDINTTMIGNQIDITAYLLKYGVVDALRIAQSQDAQVYAYSIAMAILNGDPATWATGNINSDDQLALTTFPNTAGWYVDMRIQFGQSLRLTALTAWNTVDVAAPAWVDDIFDIVKLMKRGNPRNRIILMDNQTYVEYMKQTDFKDMSQNGKDSTIVSGAITNMAGMDLFITDLLALSAADGKLNGIAWGAGTDLNVKWNIVVLDKNTIQHGWTNKIEQDVVRDIHKWVQYKSAAWFGFGSLDQANWTKVGLGINVTV